MKPRDSYDPPGRASHDAIDAAAVLRELTDHIEDVFYVLDLVDRRVLYVSPAYERIYGRSVEELYDNPGAWLNTVHPDDREEMEMRFAGVIAGEREARNVFEYRVQRPDGATRWLRHRAFIIRDKNGTPHRIAGHASDITAETRATEALRETSQRLQVFFDAYPDLMFLTDREGTFIDFMTSHENELYMRPSEFLGRRYDEVLPQEVSAKIGQAMREMWATGEPQRMDYWLEMPDGSRRAFEAYLKPVPRRGAAGYARDEEYAIIVAREITDRKRAEMEISRARDELEQRVEQRTAELAASREAATRAERLASIGTLAAGIAHEINNPLGSIMMAVDLALASMDDREAMRIISDSLESIKSDARRAGLIVRSVLQFSRQEVPQKWANDMGDIARRARDLTRQRASDAGIEVMLSIEDDLPEAMVNPTELEQVFVNLINNAIDATTAAGRREPVAVSVRRVDGRMIIEVKDAGEGIAGDATGYIFDPFYTSRQEAGGTGLGLSVTHGIVRQHQGRINVDSRAGVGTAITVDIPIGDGGRS